MYWILAATFLLIMFAMFAAPRLRLAGIGILVALLAFGMVQRMRSPYPASPALPQRSQSASPSAPQRVISLDSVAMEGMQLSGSGAPFELSGRIVNQTHDAQLKSVTIHITRRDCRPGALDPTRCVVLWQDRHWMPLNVPPKESREFAASIWMRGSVLRPGGTIHDSFELVAATGEAVAQSDRPGA